ncbi:MAG: polysaccharide lyase 8 family protein [Bacteroidota bacterium]|nr:polysaccharide lyase 8 family protein [Bacteroidota bacterium]
MKPVFTLLALLIGLNLFASTNEPEKTKVLKQNVITYILRDKANPQRIKEYFATVNDNGQWPDVDYASKQRGQWPTYKHLTRLLEMAIAYKSADNSYYNNPALFISIRKALDYWINADLQNPNWWYPQIGVPKTLGPIILLIQAQLTEDEMAKGIKILERAKIGMTGQNKVWLSGNVIYRSLLTGDVDMINEAAKAIQSEINISLDEGVQPDFSFHQHGPQQQFGNYGLAFAADMTKWAIMFEGTPFRFDDAKIEILRNYLLNGIRWVLWKGKLDVSACGRQLFPNAQTEKARTLNEIYSEMPLADNTFSRQYAEANKDFSGNAHFWTSDMSVHRRNNFYASVRMCSKRVLGGESVNSENLLGYHLGDGALLVYQSGNEYDDIFPFWDWKKIPGTTSFQDSKPLPVLAYNGYYINSEFVGGISDGMNGVAAMDFRRDGLQALKSWFFFDDVIVCLGAGIKTQAVEPVTTSVNQCFLNGNVLVNNGQKTSLLSEDTHNLNNIKWVLHNNIGYYFPGKSQATIDNTTKTGIWHNVATQFSEKELKADIFSLWLNHGVKPENEGYAYYIIPGADESLMQSVPQKIKIISNTDSVQAVTYLAKGLAGVIFYKAGQCQLSSSLSIGVDAPCILMLSITKAERSITLSDPTHKLASIAVNVSGKFTGSNIPGKFDSLRNKTSFQVVLPKGFEAGKSISFKL